MVYKILHVETDKSNILCVSIKLTSSKPSATQYSIMSIYRPQKRACKLIRTTLVQSEVKKKTFKEVDEHK